MNRERLAGGIAFGVVGLLLAASAVNVARRWDTLKPVVSGDAAPDFSLPRIESGEVGDRYTLSSSRGVVVLLDFWATWCEPCRASMPRLDEIARRYADRGLTLVSVNTEGPKMIAKAALMAARLSPSATVVSDDGRVADLYGVTTIPHLVLISASGAVLWLHRGGLSSRTADELRRRIDDALGKPAPR